MSVDLMGGPGPGADTGDRPDEDLGVGAEGFGSALPERLERLFATVVPPSPDGRSYSNADIAERATAAGHPISESYVYQLRRRDQVRNPTMRSVQALAAAFGVSVRYFFDDDYADRLDEDLPVLAALRDPAVREMTLLLDGLSAPTLEALMHFAVIARRWEGLSAPER